MVLTLKRLVANRLDGKLYLDCQWLCGIALWYKNAVFGANAPRRNQKPRLNPWTVGRSFWCPQESLQSLRVQQHRPPIRRPKRAVCLFPGEEGDEDTSEGKNKSEEKQGVHLAEQ